MLAYFRYDSAYEPRYDALSRPSVQTTHQDYYSTQSISSLGGASAMPRHYTPGLSSSASRRAPLAYDSLGSSLDGSTTSYSTFTSATDRTHKASSAFDSTRPINARDIKSRLDRERLIRKYERKY